jgi:hypothetical protein
MGSVNEDVYKFVDEKAPCGPPSSTWGLVMVGIMVKDRQVSEETNITAIATRRLKRVIMVFFVVTVLEVPVV